MSTTQLKDRILISINNQEIAHEIQRLSSDLGISRADVVALAIKGRLPR